jgi:hypothetical protein
MIDAGHSQYKMDKDIAEPIITAAEEEIQQLWDDVDALSSQLRELREELAEQRGSAGVTAARRV